MHVSQCGLEAGGVVKERRPEVPECSFNRAAWFQIFVLVQPLHNYILNINTHGSILVGAADSQQEGLGFDSGCGDRFGAFLRGLCMFSVWVLCRLLLLPT